MPLCIEIRRHLFQLFLFFVIARDCRWAESSDLRNREIYLNAVLLRINQFSLFHFWLKYSAAWMDGFSCNTFLNAFNGHMLRIILYCFLSIIQNPRQYLPMTDLKNTTKRKPESAHHFWFSVSAAYRSSLSHHLYYILWLLCCFYRRTEFISRTMNIFFTIDHVESWTLNNQHGCAKTK